MEKTYVIKVLAKKDAKLNYKQAMTLTQEALAKETGAVDPKIFYVLNDIAQHKKFLKAFILLLYEQQKLDLNVIMIWFRIIMN
ncbi:hypothetical protein [Spiroplasma poulsonii]|uniref:hypothetical protein n=1 Tax=Spiroplasma poulsonii TaxID=2138 RepID=UPI000592115D|nr:hypothetical protein [Spiroplasma poulsonii]PWF96845.1 hypothetical protein SMSE_22920 [Spiroplasma poulsonii]PWF97418.1 hypothetical protein SMH99_22270 [Spiroplasma poulsonii]